MPDDAKKWAIQFKLFTQHKIRMEMQVITSGQLGE